MAKTLEQKISVMQAALDGKEIECIVLREKSDIWEAVDTDCITWNWPFEDYRIKPEPMEFWVNVYPVHSGRAYYLSEDGACSESCIKTIKVREVTDEDME